MKVSKTGAKKKNLVGRKLGKMHYIHESAVSFLAESEQTTLKKALSMVPKETQWNLAKVSLLGDRVSLLFYENFDTELFPVLSQSTIVKFKDPGIQHITYTNRENPPVLHRKELFLAPNDPRIEALAEITAFCEEKGLFKAASYIGTLKKWEQRLREHHYKVEGQKVVPIAQKLK